MSLSTFSLHFENILGCKTRSSLCPVTSIAFVWFYGKRYCLPRILKLNITDKRLWGQSIAKLLFFSPSFVSNLLCCCGEYELFICWLLLPSVVIAVFSREYLCGPWMYLEPNLWKSLKATTGIPELVWDKVEWVYAAPTDMLYVGLPTLSVFTHMLELLLPSLCPTQ